MLFHVRVAHLFDYTLTMSSEILTALWQAAAQQQFPTHALYLVATPIGNLTDISVRALVTLSKVDAIACEDTRHSKTLLNQYGIQKPLIAAHEHNENEAAQHIIERLQRGERIALITDAGTPAISDPGARVVAQVHAAGLRVVPIPGASAVVTALSAAGTEHGFSFVGFLPPKAAARAQTLSQWQNRPEALVFYEAPHRLHDTIAALAQAFSLRRLTIARELTKLYEDFVTIDLNAASAWLAQAAEPRGEYVLVLHEAPANTTNNVATWHETLVVLLKELPLKQAVALTVTLTHAPKNEVYAHALSLKNQA